MQPDPAVDRDCDILAGPYIGLGLIDPISKKIMIFQSGYASIIQLRYTTVRVFCFIKPTTKEISMKAIITKECMGDRNCNKLCPEVFEYDEDQLLSIVKYDQIPKHLEAIVQKAADECGANAIIIEEE
jgi:ferredoxin